jgi:phosphoenolpyruvate carboxykinase (diphosphate)
VGTRLARGLRADQPVLTPVNAVLSGRRNNPPDRGAGIRSLAVYNPIHHMELPELFMEFICSMTGKSPSTTGAGSEGALTKGPFNALPPIYDLNAALVAYAVSGSDGYVTAAGYVGPESRVDHDISLLVPEVWCRMSVEERSPEFLLAHGYLERLEDFEHEGRKVLASRLGSRITKKFANTFFGRVFNHPHVVLTDEMLRPELQGMENFIEGMDNIVATQKRVAGHYFADGSIAWACPPLRALLHIMRDDHYEGKTLGDTEIRALFRRENVLSSDWYHERLRAKQGVDARLWERHVNYLERFQRNPSYAGVAERMGIAQRLEAARTKLAEVHAPDYVERLVGMTGAEPAVPEPQGPRG